MRRNGTKWNPGLGDRVVWRRFPIRRYPPAQNDYYSCRFGPAFSSGDGSIDRHKKPSHNGARGPERHHVQRRYVERQNDHEQEKEVYISKDEEVRRQDVTVTGSNLGDRLRAVFLLWSANALARPLWLRLDVANFRGISWLTHC
jgi:hypothetical protein